MRARVLRACFIVIFFRRGNNIKINKVVVKAHQPNPLSFTFIQDATKTKAEADLSLVC